MPLRIASLGQWEGSRGHRWQVTDGEEKQEPGGPGASRRGPGLHSIPGAVQQHPHDEHGVEMGSQAGLKGDMERRW